MKNKISFILTSLLFSASLSALAETTKIKEFPAFNIIGNQDRISLSLTHYMKGNNKYSLTPATEGVKIGSLVTQIENGVDSIGTDCKPVAPLPSDTHLFVCESKRLQKIKITFDEKTKKSKWEKIEEPIDLEALLKKKNPDASTDKSKYECNNFEQKIKSGNTDLFLISCYHTNGEKESLVHVVFDLKKKSIENRFDFENKAESKTPKLFVIHFIKELEILTVKNFFSDSSAVLKLYTVTKDTIPKIQGEKIIIPSKIKGLDSAFILSNVASVKFKETESSTPVNDLLLLGTKPEAMLAYSFKIDKSDLSKLTLRNSHLTALPSAKYGPTFGAEVGLGSPLLIFIGKNSMKFVVLRSDGSLKIDENMTKRFKNFMDFEHYYSCSQSTKANEIFTKGANFGEGGNVQGISFFTKGEKVQTKGIAIFSTSSREIQCIGDLKTEYIFGRKLKKKEKNFGSEHTNLLFTGLGNKRNVWEIKEAHTLSIDGSKLTAGKKTIKLEVKNQKSTGGPAPISFNLQIEKFNDIASSKAVINVPAKSINIFPGKGVKIPVGIENTYGNNLKFKVEAKGAKSVSVNYNNKITLTIPKSGSTLVTGKFNSFIPMENDYFLQSQAVNGKTSTHIIYQCNVLATIKDKVTCKFISKFTLAKELILKKGFILKDRLLLIITRTDSDNFRLASLNLAKLPTTEISKDLTGIKEVFKKDGKLSKFKISFDKPDKVLIWWFYTDKDPSSSKIRGTYAAEKYTVDYTSSTTGMISRAEVIKPEFKVGKKFYDVVITTSIVKVLGAYTNKLFAFRRDDEEGKGVNIKKGTYEQGVFVITDQNSLGSIDGKNKILCGYGKFVSILDTSKLTLTLLDATVENEETKIHFPITVPGGAETDKITKIVQSMCVEGSSYIQILATNSKQDKKWLFNLRIDHIYNGLKRSHSVIEIGKEVNSFDSYVRSFSGKIITTLIKETESETSSRDIYIFNTKGPDISINTEGMTQNEIEVKIKAEGKTPEGKFTIKKVVEVTELKVTSTTTDKKFPTFKKGETVVLDSWAKVVGSVVDVAVNIPDDLKTKVTFNSRKTKKYGWKVGDAAQMKKVFTKRDLMFVFDGKKIDVIYKPAEFSEKYKNKRIVIQSGSSSKQINDFIACSIDKTHYFVALISQNEISIVYIEIVTSSGSVSLFQKKIVEFKKSQDVKQAFIVSRDKNIFTYVEALNQDRNLVRVRGWERTSDNYSNNPGFDRYISPSSSIEAIDVFDIGSDKIMILYGNHQFDSLSALVVKKKTDKTSELYDLVSRFNGLQFLENKEYGLPENLSCEIKDKLTNAPKSTTVYTHTLNCFIDIVGAKDYYYSYKINAKAEAKKKEKLITEIKKITSVQNMKGFKILKAVTVEKYTALLMDKLPEVPKPTPKLQTSLDNLQMFKTRNSLSQKPKNKLALKKETPINKCQKIIAIYSPEASYPFTIITCNDLGLAEGSKDSVDISMDDSTGDYLYITIPPAKKTGRRILADSPSINTFSIKKASLTMKEDNVPLDKIKIIYKTPSGKNLEKKAIEFSKNKNKTVNGKIGGISYTLIIIISVIILLLIIICLVIIKRKGGDQEEGSVILNEKETEICSVDDVL